MSTAENIAGQVISWTARLGGLLLIYFLVRYFKPAIFYKGWSNLQAAYGLVPAALPAGLALHHTSLRVGVEHYNQTAHFGLGPAAAYLQRPALASAGTLLCIPYRQIQLVEPPSRTGPLNSPVYGIFRVDGVEVWIDSPYAEQLTTHLPTP